MATIDTTTYKREDLLNTIDDLIVRCETRIDELMVELNQVVKTWRDNYIANARKWIKSARVSYKPRSGMSSLQILSSYNTHSWERPDVYHQTNQINGLSQVIMQLNQVKNLVTMSIDEEFKLRHHDWNSFMAPITTAQRLLSVQGEEPTIELV